MTSRRHVARFFGVRVTTLVEPDQQRVEVTPDEDDLHTATDADLVAVWAEVGRRADNLRSTLPGWRINGLTTETARTRSLRNSPSSADLPPPPASGS